MWKRIKMFFINLFKPAPVIKPKPVPVLVPEPIPEEIEFCYPPEAIDVRKRTLKYYQSLWDHMTIKEGHRSEIRLAIKRIAAYVDLYKEAERYTGVDWRITAILHYMESGCDVRRQILNGEYITRKTKKVPKGYGPWEGFAESCVDAYKRHPFHKGMTVAEVLYRMERFNGLGYIRKGIHSPYLWSYSNHYTSGKYIEKKILFKWVSLYKKNLVSRQIGAAILLKELM